MSGKLDHVSKSWNNTERSARKASPPRSAIGRVPYAPKPPAAFTKSWNRPRPTPSARFKPISGPPHRRSCWPSRRYVAVPCTATLSTAPTSRVRSPLKTRTATRIYFIYRAVRPLSNRMAMLPGAVAGGRFPHGRADLGRLREGRHPRGPDRRGRGLPQSTETRVPAADRFRRARRQKLERADHEVLHKADLVGRLVLAVVNFPPRQIANFFSEVLTLGVVLGDGNIVLVHPERDVPLGSRIA